MEPGKPGGLRAFLKRLLSICVVTFCSTIVAFLAIRFYFNFFC